MPNFLDFIERAGSGPMLIEKDFNMKSLIPNVRNIVKKYEITLDKENPISSDDVLADRLYEAAVELLVCTGIYCQDTNRVLQLDRKEILRSVHQFREGAASFGEGKDRRAFLPRKPEDHNLPWLHVGTGIVASSEEIATAQVEGYGSITEANSVSIPAFSHVRGMPVTGGSPLEIYAAIGSVQAARKALSRCGRPGLPIMNLLSSSTTAMGTIAGSYPAFGLRPSDGWLIDVLAEMKVNYETLNRLAFIQITGGNIGSTAIPIILSQVPSGYAGIQTPHPAKAVIDDAVTPMEAKFAVEFARAITGISAHEANEFTNRLLEKYEDDIVNAPQGKKYQECYDLKTQRPSEEYIRLYDEVVEEMIQMGISFK